MENKNRTWQHLEIHAAASCALQLNEHNTDRTFQILAEHSSISQDSLLLQTPVWRYAYASLALSGYVFGDIGECFLCCCVTSQHPAQSDDHYVPFWAPQCRRTLEVTFPCLLCFSCHSLLPCGNPQIPVTWPRLPTCTPVLIFPSALQYTYQPFPHSLFVRLSILPQLSSHLFLLFDFACMIFCLHISMPVFICLSVFDFDLFLDHK